MNRSTFQCYQVNKDASDQITAGMVDTSASDLPEGDVTIQVSWSSLNYKDALAAGGHPGVARHLPHVPGIDAAGTVLESSYQGIQVGDEVIVTGHELGAGVWGGWSQQIRVPGSWVVPLPSELTLRESMILGTAGFTAAQCVAALEKNNITPDSGEIVVTGSTGGVGSLAVKILAKLGYEIAAVTGKEHAHDLLRQWGASQVITREEVVDESTRPLLKSRWAGAVDTVGGNTLSTLIRSTQVDGCVTACGLVGGIDLPITVHPFILRGVTLAGITSAQCETKHRLDIWKRLAGPWRLENLEEIVTEIPLNQVDGYVKKILAGEILGRVLIALPK